MKRATTAEAGRRRGKREGRGDAIPPSPSLKAAQLASSPRTGAFLWTLCLAAAMAAGSCARADRGGAAGSAPPAPAYPYAAAERRLFYATAGGLAEGPGRPPAGAPLRASVAPNASVLTSDGRTVLVAVNGWGLARLESSPGGEAFRVAESPFPEPFAGLSTAGAWPLGGPPGGGAGAGAGAGTGFLVHFYRDPYAGGPEAASGEGGAGSGSARLLYLDREGLLAAPDPFALATDRGFELFALYPAAGQWLAELREEGPERVRFRFFALEDPRAAGAALRELGRPEFEAALRPRPISSLRGEGAAELRAAIAALGPGEFLVRLRSAKGEDGWYLTGGEAWEARPAFAWREEGRAIALRGEGRLAVARAGAPLATLSLEPPLQGAAFTALAVAGELGVAAWEGEGFPELSAAGLLTVPLARKNLQ